MYSNDGSVLGFSLVAGPTVLGIALWPDAAVLTIAIALLVVSLGYLGYKRLNRK